MWYANKNRKIYLWNAVNRRLKNTIKDYDSEGNKRGRRKKKCNKSEIDIEQHIIESYWVFNYWLLSTVLQHYECWLSFITTYWFVHKTNNNNYNNKKKLFLSNGFWLSLFAFISINFWEVALPFFSFFITSIDCARNTIFHMYDTTIWQCQLVFISLQQFLYSDEMENVDIFIINHNYFSLTICEKRKWAGKTIFNSVYVYPLIIENA